MEGKIFNDTSNVYQDQAKVLYEYYKSAAEKIVAEEKSLEDKIRDAEYQMSKLDEDCAKAKSTRTIGWILCWTIVGLIIALLQNSKAKGFEKQIDGKKKEIAKYKQAYKDIFRDYKVTKMGLAYVPVAKRVAYGNKSFIIDNSGIAKKETFTLQVLKQSGLVDQALTDLQDLTKEAPIVESSNEPESVNTSEFSKSIQKVNFNDYFGKMDRILRTISYGLGNVSEYNVNLPVVFPDTEYAQFLREHASSDVEGAPVFHVFDSSQYDDDIRRFNELNETRKSMSNESEQVEKVLKNIIVDMADAVQSTSEKKVTSAGGLIDYSNRILFNVLKAPYDFYSPVLEAEEIDRIKNEDFEYESVDYTYKPFNLKDSSKVRLDIYSMSWVADDGSRTTTPFGVNQIQSEIIAPIVTNLLKDTRKERIAIYDHIKDQKLSYLNKWHQDTEDFYGRNRAEAADIINLMRSTLAEYSAAYNTLEAYKKTEVNMAEAQDLEHAVTETKDNTAEVLAGYQAQSQQVIQTQKDFADYMDRLQEDIDRRAAKFGYVEYYDASLRDRKAKDTAVAADNVNLLEDRRKPLAEVSPLLAQNIELPPTPSIEDSVYEYARMNLKAEAREAIESLNRIEEEQISHAEKKEDVVERGDVVGSAPVMEQNEEGCDVVGNEDGILDLKKLEETLKEFEETLEELSLKDPEDKFGVTDYMQAFVKIKNKIKTSVGEEISDELVAQVNDLVDTVIALKRAMDASESEETEDE